MAASPEQQQLLLLFRHKLLKQLWERDKITEATIEILDRFRHPGFSVFQGQPIEPDETTGREKLAIYSLHPPVALGRIGYQPCACVAFHPAKPAAMLRINRDDTSCPPAIGGQTDQNNQSQTADRLGNGGQKQVAQKIDPCGLQVPPAASCRRSCSSSVQYRKSQTVCLAVRRNIPQTLLTMTCGLC